MTQLFSNLYKSNLDSFINVIKDNLLVFCPIEHFNWRCLTIGALGWGQIQIANSNNIVIDTNQTRKDWMLKLCDVLELFYPPEIEKIAQRITHFSEIRKYWKDK